MRSAGRTWSHFCPLRPTWYLGRLNVASLGAIRRIRHEPFRALPPHRLVGELVDALDSGGETPGDRFAERYRALRRRFRPARARGKPILVARRIPGPYTEVDGLTRLSMLVSRPRMGQDVPSEIGVLLGVSPRIGSWSWY